MDGILSSLLLICLGLVDEKDVMNSMAENRKDTIHLRKA
jgi:hypothetical protein